MAVTIVCQEQCMFVSNLLAVWLEWQAISRCGEIVSDSCLFGSSSELHATISNWGVTLLSDLAARSCVCIASLLVQA